MFNFFWKNNLCWKFHLNKITCLTRWRNQIFSHAENFSFLGKSRELEESASILFRLQTRNLYMHLWCKRRKPGSESSQTRGIWKNCSENNEENEGTWARKRWKSTQQGAVSIDQTYFDTNARKCRRFQTIECDVFKKFSVVGN